MIPPSAGKHLPGNPEAPWKLVTRALYCLSESCLAETTVKSIEDAFREFTSREVRLCRADFGVVLIRDNERIAHLNALALQDIAILLINQYVSTFTCFPALTYSCVSNVSQGVPLQIANIIRHVIARFQKVGHKTCDSFLAGL